MKWAKSRNVKNCLRSSRSLGTPASGWRAASSETIRGDADPTWCTCSSALGRPAMKDWRLTPGSVSADHLLGDIGDREPVALDLLPVDEHRRGRVDPRLGRRVLGGGDPALELHVLDAGAYVGLGGACLHGQVDEVVLAREGTVLVRLVVEQQVVELLGDLGARGVQDDRERVG